MTTPSLPELPTPDVPNTRMSSVYLAYENGSYSAAKVREIVASALAADRAATAPAPKVLTDEQIDRIAENCAKAMPDGIRGFCKTWGWRQFARELLDVCAGHERSLTAPDRAANSPEVTDAMIEAYLRANDAYWRETDAWMTNDPSKWRNGNPKEATRVSLLAALAVGVGREAEHGSVDSVERPGPPAAALGQVNEPVAWTTDTDLAYMQGGEYGEHRGCTMWREREGHPVPLYAAPLLAWGDKASRKEADRLADVFDRGVYDSHDIIDAATLLCRLSRAPNEEEDALDRALDQLNIRDRAPLGAGAAELPEPALTVRQMIEGAWCAGYYDAGYTNDGGYADMMASKCADALLGAVAVDAAPEPQPLSDRFHLDLCASQDDTMPGHPICDCGFRADAAPEPELLLSALNQAWEWIKSAGHGDDCFLRDEGEYSACFCGRESVMNALESAIAATDCETEHSTESTESGCSEGAVDAAPQQNPDSVHQVGAPVGLSDAAGHASPWIAVSERLPGKQGNDSADVLLFINGHCALTDMECRAGGAWGIRIGFYDAEKNYFRVHGRPADDITHWMPLPAPPALGMPEAELGAPDGVIAGTTEWTKEGIPLPAPPAEAPKEQQQ